jgi:cytochrome b pre-mRNA-processing protein 3
MILPLFRRSRPDASIDRLYGAIVAQSRLPVFYSHYAVPDTVEGRLDMIMLHALLLLLYRMRGEESALQAIGQRVFDRFCADMDDNLREMGVGDLAVPKVMQRIASAFYGRAKVYEAALAGDGDLVAALRRNIYAPTQGEAAQAAERLAGYVRAAVAHLRQIGAQDLAAGALSFPEPCDPLARLPHDNGK